MEQLATPLTRKVAAAIGEGDQSYLKLDKQYTLVTSEDIVPAEMEKLLTDQGMDPASSATGAQLIVAYMNSKAKVVGPTQAPTIQPPAQAASNQVAPPVRAAMDTDEHNEDEMTEVEVTDSEDECKVANEEADSGKKREIKKKTRSMTKKTKKAKVESNSVNK